MAFVDIEGWLIESLTDALTGVSVGTEVPTGSIPSPRFIVIRRLGGTTRTRVSDEPMLAVEAYGRSRAEAVALIDDARQHILGLSGVHADLIVYRVDEVSGPAHLPNPTAPLHTRYTLTVILRVRA